MDAEDGRLGAAVGAANPRGEVGDGAVGLGGREARLSASMEASRTALVRRETLGARGE